FIDESKELELFADNNFYDPYRVSLADLREIWYIRARITPFLPSPQNIQRYVQEEMIGLKETIQQQGKMINRLSAAVDRIGR
ncbi:MAG: peptidase S24, partial [Bacteroidota bacterium]